MFLHIDMDSFFISAERSRNRTLRGVPAAVGSRSNLEIFDRERRGYRLMDRNSGAFVTPVWHNDSKREFESYFIDRIDGSQKIRGIITTASYEARSLGIKTGMPIAHALRLCPNLRVVPSDMIFYHEISHKISEFLNSRIAAVEQYSIDEFFADISGWVDDTDAEDFAKELKKDIFEEFHIPVSIGISRAKWIAKLATGFAKPFGIYRVEDIDSFTEKIPIEEFPGIGRGYRKRLSQRGVKYLGEIKALKSLFDSWGLPGRRLYRRILGIDGEGIERASPRKSIGISRTFDPIYDSGEIRRRIAVMARHISHIAMRLGVSPTRYHLSVRYEYGIRAKGSLRADRLFSEKLLRESLTDIYNSIRREGEGAVKLSASVSDFISTRPIVLSLFDIERDRKMRKIDEKVHLLREKFGMDILKSGAELVYY